MTLIAQRLQTITQQIADVEARCGRTPGSVTLLAASKSQPVDSIIAAYNAGLLHFGENYLQEALEKIQQCPKDIIWHFIGPIQSNKTRKIAEHFSWVHSVSDKKIAKRLSEQRPAHLPPLQLCIEVNISEEDSKSGINRCDLTELAEFCEQLPRLTLRGLMAIPAPHLDTEKTRLAFRELASLKEKLNKKGRTLDTLSMGMSHDYELAIEECATIIRIGTALFGPRKS